MKDEWEEKGMVGASTLDFMNSCVAELMYWREWYLRETVLYKDQDVVNAFLLLPPSEFVKKSPGENLGEILNKLETGDTGNEM